MPIDRIRQAVADVGCGAIASHRSAAFLWGLIPEPSVADLIVPRAHRPRPRPATEIHRPRALDVGEISIRAGIRCTNPLRTLADLGAVEPGWVDAALTAAAVSRLVSPSAAAAALERLSVRGRLGLGPLRAALADWPCGIDEPDSELEVLMGRCSKTRRSPDSYFTRSSRDSRSTLPMPLVASLSRPMGMSTTRLDRRSRATGGGMPPSLRQVGS